MPSYTKMVPAKTGDPRKTIVDLKPEAMDDRQMVDSFRKMNAPDRPKLAE